MSEYQEQPWRRNPMNGVPVGRRVLIKQHEQREEVVGGIVIPDMVEKWAKPIIGEVVSHGGDVSEMEQAEYPVGSHVQVGPGGSGWKYGNTTFYLTHCDQILMRYYPMEESTNE